MPRDYRTLLDEARAAAADGATAEDIQDETGLAPQDIARVIQIEDERRRRREARRG